MADELLHKIAEKEDFTIQNATHLSGGSINSVFTLETSDGKLVIKLNAKDHSAGMFHKEAAGLQLLKASDSFKIPEVFSTGEIDDQAYLLLEHIPAEKKETTPWADFAARLAQLHRHSADTFGLDHDNYIGSLPQYNQSKTTDAGEFYIENRIKPQLEMAGENGFSFGNLNAFYKHIAYMIPKENPALVHGDLWAENYILAQGKIPALIDPAVAYAPREMDLAMMELFGGFPEEVFVRYNELFPLENGWEERRDIWQLYYLLVHLNLFGQNYFHPVNRIIGRFR